MPPLAIAAGIGAVGSIGSAIIGSGAASDAAAAQERAARQAANYSATSAQNAINYQTGTLGQTQQLLQPYYQSGTAGLANLDYLLGIQPTGTYGSGYGAAPGASTGAPVSGPRSNAQFPNAPTANLPGGAGGIGSTANLVNPSLGGFGSLAQGWQGQFVAPTGATEVNDPGYQFRLQQGVNALQNSAAARGTLLSGGTAAGINAYGQDYASNEYANVYGRALGQYQQQYQQFMQNQQNEYNRLAGLAQGGQQTAETLGQFGQAAAGNVGNLLMGSAGQVGQYMTNAGQAAAAGDINAANQWGGALGNVANLAAGAYLGRQSGQNTNQTTSGFQLPTSSGTYDPVTGSYGSGYGPNEYNPLTGGYG